jgi:hypothetical protein
VAYFIIEYRETVRKKWKTVDAVNKKEVAETNALKYSEHIRKEEELNGMEYRVRKVKGTLKGESNERLSVSA